MNAPSRITSYALYGEDSHALLPDYLHFETIRERSSKHNWEIARHRHENLAQIFLFASVGVRIMVEDEAINTSEPMALYLPPMVSHGFHFRSDVEGGVITLAASRIGDLARFMELDEAHFSRPLLIGGHAEVYAQLAAAFNEVSSDYHGFNAYRKQALGAGLARLMVCLARASSHRLTQSPAQPADREEQLVQRFCRMVEEHFTSDWRVSEYAKALGTSEVSLTRACRRILNMPPRRLVLNRLVLEAKRELAYTPRNVSQIAFNLGFRDVGYFSRFFTKSTGDTPSSFREKTRRG